MKRKNSTKKRPLGIPSTEDKLVQEVVKMILESIYEPKFSDYSHGFRPNRSCHSALQQIQNQFTGITWFVEGDIHACFDSFDHHVLVNILRERIEDENFLALIWKMLKAGYMEQWVYNCTFSGTPQGSGVSPMLANIYLSKLDEFAERLKREFSKGKSKDNLEYSRAASCTTSEEETEQIGTVGMSNKEKKLCVCKKMPLAISTAYQVSEQIMKTTKVWSTVDMRMIS